MANFKGWKERTAKLKRKIAGKAMGVLRWGTNDDKREVGQPPYSQAEQPLLRAAATKTKKTAWDSNDEFKGMSDYAVASAMISATLSNETKSTVSSGGLYRSTSSHEERFEFPNFHKRDIYMADGNRNCHEDTHKIRPGEYNNEKKTLASYSISGSMLCSNIDKGCIPVDSTSAARKLTSPLKPTGLPPNAVMASTLFRTMKLDDRPHRITEPTKRDSSRQRPTGISMPPFLRIQRMIMHHAPTSSAQTRRTAHRAAFLQSLCILPIKTTHWFGLRIVCSTSFALANSKRLTSAKRKRRWLCTKPNNSCLLVHN